MEVLEHLKARAGGNLGGIQFLATIQQELGISFVRTRQIMAYFDPKWNPIAEQEVIDEEWRAILDHDEPVES